MTLRCLIVDDEPLACRLISKYVERTPGLELAGAFTSASAALAAVDNLRPDLAFLDIQMPEISGIELARRLPEATHVVFTTAYRDYAVEGFRVNALDYLLKPISYDEFLEAVGRASSFTAAADPYISVKSEYRLVRIRIADILYIESLKDYIKIYIADRDRPVLTLMSLKAVETILPADSFMRVHRSFIVNTTRIDVIERGHLIVAGARIPISDTYRPNLFSRLNPNNKPL